MKTRTRFIASLAAIAAALPLSVARAAPWRYTRPSAARSHR